ncbi:MAG TPA: hypothetical protein VM694_08350 [Polyangium sp.]|nr:hypothetical protein [Polyangium sp.]
MANETAQNKPAAATPALAAAAPELREPIIIDLGKKKRRQVKKLRKGKEGSLLDKVNGVLEEGIAARAIPADAQTVVVVVREKKKKNKLGKYWGLG